MQITNETPRPSAPLEAHLQLRSSQERVTTAIIVSLILVMPWVILLSGMRLVPRLSSIDPWLYIGGFLNLEDLYSRFGITYYISRLPWLLLGKLTYSALPAQASHITLGLLVYFSFTTSLFCIARKFYEARIALFVSVLAGSNPLLIFHSFWGHVDVPSMALALAAVAALIRAEGRWMPALAALAGLVFSLSITTHLFTVVLFAPALLVNTITYARAHGLRALSRCGFVVLGFGAGMAILGVAGHFVYNNPFFWMAQIQIAQWVVSGGWHSWAKPLSEWTPAGPLVIPLALIVSSLALTFARFSHIRRDRGTQFLYPYVGLIFAVFVITDFGMGGARLQHAWYYVFLVGPSLLLFAPLLYHWIDSSNRDKILLVLLCSYAAAAVGCLFLAGRLQLDDSIPTYLLFSAALVLALSFLLTIKPLIKWAVSLSLSLLMLLGSTFGHDLPEIFPKADQWKDFEQCIALHQAIRPHLSEDRALWFLYNNEPETRYLFNSVNALYLGGFSLLSTHLPEIQEDRRWLLDRPSSVVILAKDGTDVEGGLHQLSEIYKLEHVSIRETIIIREEMFHLAIAQASPREP